MPTFKQLMGKIKPKQEVELIRKNLIVNKLQKSERVMLNLFEVQVYEKRLALESRLAELKRVKSEKMFRVEKLALENRQKCELQISIGSVSKIQVYNAKFTFKCFLILQLYRQKFLDIILENIERNVDEHRKMESLLRMKRKQLEIDLAEVTKMVQEIDKITPMKNLEGLTETAIVVSILFIFLYTYIHEYFSSCA